MGRDGVHTASVTTRGSRKCGGSTTSLASFDSLLTGSAQLCPGCASTLPRLTRMAESNRRRRSRRLLPLRRTCSAPRRHSRKRCGCWASTSPLPVTATSWAEAQSAIRRQMSGTSCPARNSSVGTEMSNSFTLMGLRNLSTLTRTLLFECGHHTRDGVCGLIVPRGQQCPCCGRSND